MTQTLGYVSFVVREYDEAIAFFTQMLGFDLIEDSPSKDRAGEDKRWVLVAPPNSRGTKNSSGEGLESGRGISDRQSDGRPRLHVPAHRRFLA